MKSYSSKHSYACTVRSTNEYTDVFGVGKWLVQKY